MEAAACPAHAAVDGQREAAHNDDAAAPDAEKHGRGRALPPLAAVNARHTAKWIATGETPPEFEEFSAKRFKTEGGHVSTHH